jgi:hypothetical protein
LTRMVKLDSQLAKTGAMPTRTSFSLCKLFWV